MLVLGIESTCDETGCAVVRDGKEILSNVISSQSEIHLPFGGVFPEIASRLHHDALIPLIEQALNEAGVKREEIGLIAAAHGPGLIGSLLMGLTCAKALAWAWNKPFIGINHVEAHLYAAMMAQEKISFPALGVVLSGGHTFLVHIRDIGTYTLIGTTLDDALGEAFDKVAALLDLPYPGGPAIEKLATQGDPSRYAFKGGHVKGSFWDFSFSGLKTSVLYAIKGQNGSRKTPSLLAEEEKPHIAASFQEIAFDAVIKKIVHAIQEYPCETIFLGGGVCRNERLRSLLKKQNLSIPLHWAPPSLCLDNAAMVAGLAFPLFVKRGKGDDLDLEPMTRIPF